MMLAANVAVAEAVDLTKATIVYNPADAPLVKQMAQVLSDDVGRVSGTAPQVGTRKVSGPCVIIGTVKHTGRHRELRGTWERYAIDTKATASTSPVPMPADWPTACCT